METELFLLKLEKLTQSFYCEGYTNTSRHFDANFLYKETGSFIKRKYDENKIRIFDIVTIIVSDIIKYGRLGDNIKSEEELQKLNYLLRHNVFDEEFYSLIKIFSYPAKAYCAYKRLDYKAAVNDTILAINEMCKMQEEIPVIYAMKLEQVRNILRIDFKAGSKEDACLGYSNLMQHLCKHESINNQFGLTIAARDLVSISIQQVIFEELFLDCAYNLLAFDWENIDKIFITVFKNIPNQINSNVNFFTSLLWIKAVEEIIYTNKDFLESYSNTIAFISQPNRESNDLKFILLCMLLMKKEFCIDKQQTERLSAGIINFISLNLSTERNDCILHRVLNK